LAIQPLHLAKLSAQLRKVIHTDLADFAS